MNDLGERIRLIQEGSDLRSNKAFGDAIGVSHTMVAKMKDGQSKPGYETIVSILERFNIEPNWFFFGQGEMEKKDEPYQKTIVKSYSSEGKNIYEEIDALWEEVENLKDSIASSQ